MFRRSILLRAGCRNFQKPSRLPVRTGPRLMVAPDPPGGRYASGPSERWLWTRLLAGAAFSGVLLPTGRVSAPTPSAQVPRTVRGSPVTLYLRAAVLDASTSRRNEDHPRVIQRHPRRVPDVRGPALDASQVHRNGWRSSTGPHRGRGAGMAAELDQPRRLSARPLLLPSRARGLMVPTVRPPWILPCSGQDRSCDER